jgi:hypothetical protein
MIEREELIEGIGSQSVHNIIDIIIYLYILLVLILIILY